MEATAVRTATTSKPMAGKVVKVSDNAGLDVLVGETNGGLTGYRRG